MTNSNQPEIKPLTRTEILVVMGVTAVILLIIAKVIQQISSVSMLGLEISSRAALFGLAVAVVITLASSIVYSLWPAYRESADFYLELVIKPLIWPDLIWLGLLPGLSEELLFRGVILSALGLNVFALTVSSVLFGLLHLSGLEQWPYVVWATAIGFLLGYSAIATGNLLVPIIAHVITNLVSSILWKAGKSTDN